MRFMLRNQSDRDLVQNVLKGNANQFAVLVDRYKNLVFGTLLAKVDLLDDAEDLAQDVFLKAYRELDTLADPRKFGPWLRKISENLAINFLSSRAVRRRDLSPVLEIPSIEPPDAEFERNERHEQLHQAISQLSPRHREVILLYYFGGVSSLQRVADFLELPLSTVKGRMEDARGDLRDKLDRELEAFARERSPGSRFTKTLMAALPIALWRTNKPAAPYGFTWKAAAGMTLLLGIGLLDFASGNRMDEIIWEYLAPHSPWKRKRERHLVRLASWEEIQWVARAAASPNNGEIEKFEGVEIGNPPAASLIYTGQVVKHGEYTVMGFPGNASPGSKIVCFFWDGAQKAVADVGEDGSFRFTVPYEKGRRGFSIRAYNARGEWTSPLHPRLDYPLMGGMGRRANERGWVHITRASANEAEDRRTWERHSEAVISRTEKFRQWLQASGKTIQEFEAEGVPPPDSINVPSSPSPIEDLRWQVEPEDLKVYGYTPEGKKATCIIGANGASFTENVSESGMFTLLIPHETIEIDISPSSLLLNEKRPADFTINVTDGENRLLASHGTNPGVPGWATARAREKQKQAQQTLIGQNAPDAVFRSIDGEGGIDLKSLIGRVVLINVWGAYSAESQDLATFQLLYPELVEKDIFLLSVNVDRSVDAYRPEKKTSRLLRMMNCPFPIFKDPHSFLYKSFYVDSIPTTIILDRDGFIRFFRKGKIPRRDLRSELVKLISD